MDDKAADLGLRSVWPWWLVAASLLTGFMPAREDQGVEVALDRTSVFFRCEMEPGSEVTLRSRRGHGGVLGRVRWVENGVRFVPVVPLISGGSYQLEIRSKEGEHREIEFTVPSEEATAPTVSLWPKALLPENALKLYLHFSEPMEQGVFLDRLRLLDAKGREVPGPFRETELWSPDGRRLTVWLHPGRQKTGVNLNLEEGPVLKEGEHYTLLVDKRWRSTAGLPMKDDVHIPIQAGAADHTMPVMTRWRIHPPKAGTLAPLVIAFDEPLDTGMLKSALEVWRDGKRLGLRPAVAESGSQWSSVPEAPWQAGHYEVRATPLLEDLAGNNLLKPFEEDLQAPAATDPVLSRAFEVVD